MSTDTNNCIVLKEFDAYKRAKILRRLFIIFSVISVIGFILYPIVGIIFGVIDILGFYKHYSSETKRVKAVLNGRKHRGVVCNYTNDKTFIVDGEALVAVIVRYFDDDTIKEVVIPTGTRDRHGIPLQSCVEFVVDDATKEGALLALIQDDTIDVKKLFFADSEASNNVFIRRQFTSCTCPKCGATLLIANHGSSVCEYCGNHISLDDFKQADDIYDVSVQGNRIDNN